MARFFTKDTVGLLASSFLMTSIGTLLSTKDKEKLKNLNKPIYESLPFTLHHCMALVFVLCLILTLYFLWKDIKEDEK